MGAAWLCGKITLLSIASQEANRHTHSTEQRMDDHWLLCSNIKKKQVETLLFTNSLKKLVCCAIASHSPMHILQYSAQAAQLNFEREIPPNKNIHVLPSHKERCHRLASYYAHFIVVSLAPYLLFVARERKHEHTYTRTFTLLTNS